MDTQRGRAATLPHRRRTAADCCNAWFGASTAWSSMTSRHIALLSSPRACNHVTCLRCDYTTGTGGESFQKFVMYTCNIISSSAGPQLSRTVHWLSWSVKTTGSWGGPQAAFFFCLRLLTWAMVITQSGYWTDILQSIKSGDELLCQPLLATLQPKETFPRWGALTWRDST